MRYSLWISLHFIYLLLQGGSSQSLYRYSSFSAECEENKTIVITNVTHDNVTNPLTRELEYLNKKCDFSKKCFIKKSDIQSNFEQRGILWYEEKWSLSVGFKCVDDTFGYKGCPMETVFFKKNEQYALVSVAYATDTLYERACKLSITVDPATEVEFTNITCKNVEFTKDGEALTCDDFPKYTRSSMTLSYVVDSGRKAGFLFLAKVSELQTPTTKGSTGNTGKTGDSNQQTGHHMAKIPHGGEVAGILVGIILLLLIVVKLVHLRWKRVSSVGPTAVKMESKDNADVSIGVYSDIYDKKPKEPFEKGHAHEPDKADNVYAVPNKEKKSMPPCAPGEHRQGSTQEEGQRSKCAAITDASGGGSPVEGAYAVAEVGEFNEPESTQHHSQDSPEPTYQTLDPTFTGWAENDIK